MGKAEIGYILKGYPRTSETFIAGEILLLEASGLALRIFSLKRLQGEQRHRVFDRIAAPVIYLPETTPTSDSSALVWLWRNVPLFLRAHARLFLKRPLSWLATLGEALVFGLRYRDGRPYDWTFIKEFLQAGAIALEALESGRIAHLHAHFCHTSTTVAMFASRLSGLPFSFTAHAKDIYRADMNPGDLLAVKLARASFAVTCTRANQDYLDRLRPSGSRLVTIYHGLDLELFRPDESRDGSETENSDSASAEDARSANTEGVHDHFPLILSVGRMVEKKGFTHLVEACARLRDRGLSFRCMIVGGRGDATEAIEQSIRQYDLGAVVSLEPAVTQEQLRRIYARATLFALPCQIVESGDRDGIPNVLVEAMAMGLPVVSTSISGIPELIENERSGLLVPQKDPQALAAALARLLADAELRATLGRAARARVVEHFDARRNIIALKRLFEEALEKGKRGA